MRWDFGELISYANQRNVFSNLGIKIFRKKNLRMKLKNPYEFITNLLQHPHFTVQEVEEWNQSCSYF